MNSNQTKISNAYVLQTDVHADDRGKFEVFWEQHLLAKVDINFQPTNACHSYNAKSGTLRGLHFQLVPHGQAKLVSCVAGSVWDVIVDLRPQSPTFKQWNSHELSAASGAAIYVPSGCAHGFLTLTDDATVAYLIEGEYEPQAGRVLRWDDSAVGIEWPNKITTISKQDAEAPSWDQCEF